MSLIFLDQCLLPLCSESSLCRAQEDRVFPRETVKSLQNQDIHLGQGVCFDSLAVPGAAATLIPQMGRFQLCLNPDSRCIVPADRCIWSLRCPAWDLFASLIVQFGTDSHSPGLPETWWKRGFQNPSCLSVHSRPEALGTCSTIPVAFPHLEQGVVRQRVLSRTAWFTWSNIGLRTISPPVKWDKWPFISFLKP